MNQFKTFLNSFTPLIEKSGQKRIVTYIFQSRQAPSHPGTQPRAGASCEFDRAGTSVRVRQHRGSSRPSFLPAPEGYYSRL